MADRIQQRRDTAARWAQYNPVLLEGEVGYVTDNPNQYKIGDGIHAWNELPLRGYTGTITQEMGSDENVVISQRTSIVSVMPVRRSSTENLFDYNTLAFNGKKYYINPKSGKYIENNDYPLFVSHLIPIDSTKSQIFMKKYNGEIFDASQGYCFFDENFRLLSHGALSSNNSFAIEIPVDASYFQFSTTGINSKIFVGYQLSEEYVYFVNYTDISDIEDFNGVNESIPFNKNIFNIKKSSFNGLGYYIDPQNGENRFDSGNYGLCISHLIYLVNCGTNNITFGCYDHTFNPTWGYRFLDKNKKIISFGNMGNLQKLTLEIPLNAVYFQFSFITKGNYYVSFGEKVFVVPFDFELQNTDFFYSKNNLIGANKIIHGLYINGEGNYKGYRDGDPYGMRLLDYIPIEPNTKYTIGVIGIRTIDLTGGSNYVFFDSNYNIVEVGKFNKSNKTGANYWEFTTPENSAFLRISITKERLKGLFLYKGSWNEILDVKPFFVSPETLGTFCCSQNFENITDGKNLYDNSIQNIERRRYISPTNGGIRNQPAYDIFVSTLMRISYNKKYLTISCNVTSSFNSSTGWRFLNESLEVIDFGEMPNDNNFSLEIPIGAKYFQFSTSRNVKNIQVEYGKAVTDYEQYFGLAFNDKKLISTDVDALPNKLFFTKNRALPIYFRNFVKDFILFNPSIQMYGNGITSLKNEAAICHPSQNTNINVYDYKSLENKLLKTVESECIDETLNASKSVNIMCLGDSYTEISNWCKALKENLEEDGVNLKMIGAMHSIRSGINLGVSTENQTGGTLKGNFMSKVSGKCFVVNVSGVVEKNMPINYGNYVSYNSNGFAWTVWGYDLDGSGNGKMRLYCSNSSATLPESGTLTKTSGTGDSSINYSGIIEVNKNPFWNLSTEAFDANGVKSYFTTWNFENPDIVILQFMWNDLSNWAQKSSIDSLIENIKRFIRTFREAISNNLYFIFSIEPSAPINTGQNYDANGRKYTVIEFAKALYSEFELDEYTYICPSFIGVDPENGFGKNEVVVSSRFPDYKIGVSTDSVHCVEGGMFQIGDFITPFVHKIITLL